MRGTLIAAALAACALAAAPLRANEQPNYFGAAYVLGNFTPKAVDEALDLAGAHIQLGRELAPFFAVEGRAGSGFESVADINGVAITSRVEYWASVFGRLYLPIERVRPYALLGYTTGRATASATFSNVSVRVDDSAQDVSWGGGLELYGDESTAVMIEWVRYMDTDLYTIEAWAFGVSTHF